MIWMGLRYYLSVYKNWIISIFIFSVLFWIIVLLAYEWTFRLLNKDKILLDFIVTSLGHTLFIYLTAILLGTVMISFVKLMGFFRKKDLELILEKTTRDLKKQTNLLENELAGYKQIFSKQKTGVLITSKTHLIYANNYLLKIWGKTASQMHQTSLNNLFDSEDHFADIAQKAFIYLQKHKTFKKRLFLSLKTFDITCIQLKEMKTYAWILTDKSLERLAQDLRQDYETVFNVLSYVHNFDQNGNEDELFHQVLDTIVQLYGLQTAFFARYEDRQAKVVFATGPAAAFPLPIHSLDLSNPIHKKSALAQTILTKKPVGYNQIQNLIYYQKHINARIQAPFMATYAFPIIINGHLEGGISFFAYNPYAFSDDRINHLERLIDEICKNIQERRLRVLTQNAIRHYEERLRHQIGELEKSKQIMENQVSETSLMMNELMTAKEMAEEANRSKTDFLSNISHELRTPLNAILGFSETMEAETFGPINNKQYAEYIKYISSSGRHLLSLINDILDISRVESGRQKIDIVPIDLHKMFSDTISVISRYPNGDKRTIEMDLPAHFPPLYADERAVRQILLNLLSNAIKFTEDGGDIKVSAKKGKSNIILTVSDNGIGIPADKIKTLFKPFSQVENIMTRSHQGSGLGLALVKRLMEAHKGEVKLESTVGKGTVITCTFPQKQLTSRKVFSHDKK